MKLAADAGLLASALALVAALADAKTTKRVAALGAARLTAKGGAATLSLYNGAAQLTLTIAADVVEPGELAVNAEKLAALAGGFPKGATIAIASDTMASVSSGRSRFKLPTLPVGELSALALAGETGRAVVSHNDAIELFTRPTFALATETMRFYLCGLLLHDLEGLLASVGTDGHRLARATVPATGGGLSADRRCIIPSPTLKTITKLLAAHRDVGEITLRRSSSLFELEGRAFRLTSKTIDGTFPDYQLAIANARGANIVTVSRAELAAAFTRIAAVVEPPAVVALAWGPEQEGLHLCATADPDAALDVVAIKAARGDGRTAFKANHGLALLDAFTGDTVAIDAGDAPGRPIWITDSADPRFLTVQMPCRFG